LSSSLEIVVRVGCYTVVFAGMALWEWFAPRRRLNVGRQPRWANNLGILAIDIITVRLLVPTTAVGVAMIASERGWGLFPFLGLPYWEALVGGVITLDFAVYIQHRLFHYVPALWRLHRMHHADLDIDVTTGVRFHPLEILLSLAIKIAAVAVLGVPATAVLIFEVLLNATSMFNHSNVAIPQQLERIARWIVVTPQCIRCITQSNARKPTAILDSIYRGGTACLVPIAPSRRPVKIAWWSAYQFSATSQNSTLSGC
jgi:sterol desaturase/sphingolipid hydroxylase (fatty acid hydroxylase superfamily)